MQYSDIVICGQLCYIIIVQRTERGIKMKICHLLLDERVDDNTTVLIKDLSGTPTVCGRWYQDKILTWGSFHATLEFVEEKNIAILQLV